MKPVTRICTICACPFTRYAYLDKQTMCSPKCRAESMRRPLLARLMSHVDPRPNPYGCWIWIGSKNKKGYGQISINRKPHPAPRAMYEITYGIVLPIFLVCHDCPGGDNPACINPDHLFLGTPKDNIQDARKKNRLSSGANHYLNKRPELVRRGEGNPMSKLTSTDIPEIRRLLTFISQSEVARRFRVSRSAIEHIYFGHTWKHVP